MQRDGEESQQPWAGTPHDRLCHRHVEHQLQPAGHGTVVASQSTTIIWPEAWPAEELLIEPQRESHAKCAATTDVFGHHRDALLQLRVHGKCVWREQQVCQSELGLVARWSFEPFQLRQEELQLAHDRCAVSWRVVL